MTQPLETIEQVAERIADPSSGSGGTPTDPNIKAPAKEVAAAPEVAEIVEEVTKEEESPKPKKDPASARFGALSRKEKELRSQMSDFDRRMKEFEARENALKEKETRFSQAKRPLDLLKEMGYTYADVTQDLLGTYQEPEPDPLDEKLKPHRERWEKVESESEKLAREVEELKNQLVLKEQQETYKQVVGEIRSILNDQDKYELTNAMGDEGLQLVQEVILEYFQQNEVLLDYAEACDIVEQYYENEIMNRVLNTKKLKSRVQPTPAASPQPSKPVASPKEVKQSNTLTQAHTTASQATVDVDSMSKADAIAYLAKKLQYK